MDGPGLSAGSNECSANAHAALLRFNDTVGRLLCRATCCCSRSLAMPSPISPVVPAKATGYGVIIWRRVVISSPLHPRKPNNTSAVATPTSAQASSRAGPLRSLVASCRVNASLSDVPRTPLNI